MLKSASQLPVIRHVRDLYDDVGNIRAALSAGDATYDPVRHSAIDRYLDEYLYRNPRYDESLRLTRSEYQVFSESGEDGIIEEIFRRIDAPTSFAVEFGAGEGLRNNSTLLLVNGWRAVWFERNAMDVAATRRRFAQLLRDGCLTLCNDAVTAENIESLFAAARIPRDFDFLNISVDSNDYWIWKALSHYRPRLIVIEYNAKFRPHIKWVMRYDPDYRWEDSSYFGASLKSLELLGASKGYCLVGCNFTGVKAFFVREDLVGERFLRPFTAETHYEPPRYYLIRNIGHRPDFGDFESV